jgi:hypothetical protein
VTVGGDIVRWNDGVRTAALLRTGMQICKQGLEPLKLGWTARPAVATACPLQIGGLSMRKAWMWPYLLAAVTGRAVTVVSLPRDAVPKGGADLWVDTFNAMSAGCAAPETVHPSWAFDSAEALRLGYRPRGTPARLRRKPSVTVCLLVTDQCCGMCMDTHVAPLDLKPVRRPATTSEPAYVLPPRTILQSLSGGSSAFFRS